MSTSILVSDIVANSTIILAGGFVVLLQITRLSPVRHAFISNSSSEEGDRDLYARTKRDLATKDWPSMDHYAEAKTETIEGIIARAAAKSSRQD